METTSSDKDFTESDFVHENGEVEDLAKNNNVDSSKKEESKNSWKA